MNRYINPDALSDVKEFSQELKQYLCSMNKKYDKSTILTSVVMTSAEMQRATGMDYEYFKNINFYAWRHWEQYETPL